MASINHYQKFCVGIAVAGTMNLAAANPNQPQNPATIVCMTNAELTDLTGQYKELPYVRGVSGIGGGGGTVVIFVNAVTGSFTIVERTDIDTFCVLSLGDRFGPVPKAVREDIKEQQDKGTL